MLLEDRYSWVEERELKIEEFGKIDQIERLIRLMRLEGLLIEEILFEE